MAAQSVAKPVYAMKESLDILAVEDARTDMARLSAMLEQMGHTVVQADNGEKALDLFRQHQPDLVLMDVIMPGISGYETVRQMRRIASEWLPIVFLTALEQSGDVVRGIEAGGDDYLLKPIHFQILQAKINSLGERLRLSRRLAEQNKLLLELQLRNEEEQTVAAAHMQKLIALDTLHDAAVKFYIKPSGNFSGDLVAKARTPDARLHLMLADSAGHGLSAALAAVPVIRPFYAMTEKGFGLSAIAREMNSLVRRTMPSSHFVAVILVSINPHNQMIEVWSGGCPPPLVLDSQGRKIYQFRPRHLAMGILADEQFDDTVECYFSQDKDDCSVLMFSDGVIELKKPSGEQLDLERLLQLACASSAPDRWESLIAAIEDFAAGNPVDRDDIAMMMVQHSQAQVEAPSQERGQEQNQEVLGVCQLAWQFGFSLSTRQLKKLDVVPMLLDMILQIERDKEDRGAIFLILSELFNNALDHGLLKLDSALKRAVDGMEKYLDERARRLADLQDGQIDFNLRKLVYDGGKAQLEIRVRDSGEGFDYRREREKVAAEEQHCGGVALLDKVCSSVQYLGKGSEVIAYFDMSAKA